jgi:hypothetical protein
MFIDKLLEFDPAGTAITSTAASTNVIDLGVARDIGSTGDSTEPNVLIQVGTALTGGTSLNVQLEGAPDNGSGLPGTYGVLDESGVIPAASLVAGARILLGPLPRVGAGNVMPRFLRLNYVVVGPFTGGTVQAEIGGVFDAYAQQAGGFIGGYKSGFTVAN